ncbi:hypothetical protein AA0488_1854 [Kozakia baliensis NRIC 0488]|nr:hypothetical protein AA0488_1854 [Kozakia baliensis NRIC 0488]
MPLLGKMRCFEVSFAKETTPDGIRRRYGKRFLKLYHNTIPCRIDIEQGLCALVTLDREHDVMKGSLYEDVGSSVWSVSGKLSR